jgi:flagellar motility protein MotE (MotC chaperone)
MPDEKIKIGARVDKDLYDRVIQAGYLSQTDAIVQGLTCLLKSDKYETIGDISILQARIDELEKHNETLKTELDRAHEMQQAYVVQVQTIVSQTNQNVRQLEERLSDKKKSWWKFWN